MSKPLTRRLFWQAGWLLLLAACGKKGALQPPPGAPERDEKKRPKQARLKALNSP